MILVDTSVWIDHLHKAVPMLVDALEREEVLSHPMIVGELACGELRNRGEVLGLLMALPPATEATHLEVLHLIDQRRLMGKGLSYIDAHLIASAMVSGDVKLWTKDRRLQSVAVELDLAVL